MKDGTDFKMASLKNNINHWPVHNCSICGYECGFIFNHFGHEVVYDRGCDCTRRYEKVESTWDDVAEQYNLQSNPEVVKKMNEYWGFKND